jgi:hypothetical protein
MKLYHSWGLIVLIFAVSCAAKPDPKNNPSAADSKRKTLDQRMTENNGYKKDSTGKWIAQNDKRSPFESQGAASYFQKDFKKKEFKTADYSKKSFWGNKSYERKSYAGETDGSRFQTPSKLQGVSAREAGANANLPGRYQTEGYATSAAREAGKGPIEKSSNDAIENLRKSFQQPDMVDWKEQRSLSVAQSKGILGR